MARGGLSADHDGVHDDRWLRSGRLQDRRSRQAVDFSGLGAPATGNTGRHRIGKGLADAKYQGRAPTNVAVEMPTASPAARNLAGSC